MSHPFLIFNRSQFIYIIVAVLISLAFYKTFSSFGIGIFVFLITGSIALALAFGKIEGLPLTQVVVNFFKFKSNSNVYLWKKKEVPFRAFKKMEEVKPKEPEEKEDETGLKVAGKSKLSRLKTNIEVK